jgi:hypothetical protein
MSHPEHEHEDLFVMDFVDHPVVPCSNSPFSPSADELGCSRRARILSQEFKHALNPSPDIGREPLQMTRG